MRVLVVDDNATNRKLLRVTLEAESITVYEAADGVEALQVLVRQRPRAVISDILMPRMDGFQLCHRIRHHDQFGAIPFIFYSATYISPRDEKLALDLGADRFLRKPASAHAICEALRAMMESIRAEPSRSAIPHELVLMKEYSERVAAKLEERRLELAAKTAALLSAQEQLRQANRESQARTEQTEQLRAEINAPAGRCENAL